MVKVTDEQKAEILRLKEEGLKPKEISKKLGMNESTVYYHYSPEYKKWQLDYNKRYREKPENKRKRREYSQKPENKNKRREYMKRYFEKHPEAKERDRNRLKQFFKKMKKPRNKEIRMTIDIFTSLGVVLNPIEVWEKVGGRYLDVTHSLSAYYKAGVLKKERKGKNVFYSLDSDSPFYVIANGFFEEREREIEEQFGRS